MDDDECRRIKVLEALTMEYEAKGLELKNNLSLIGINESDLPTDVQLMIKDLADIGETLNLSNINETSITLAWTNLNIDSSFLKLENDKLQYFNDKLRRDIKKMEEQKIQLVEIVKPKAKLQINECELNIRKQTNALNSTKREKENISIELIRMKNETSSVDENFTHESIVAKSKIINDKTKVINHLRKELASFHELPPNLFKAQEALKEIKKLLAIQEAKIGFNS